MKIYISILILLAITLFSCRSTVPLVINSSVAPNTNILSSQYQVAASIQYLSNTKVPYETDKSSHALVGDAKFAVTKNIFPAFRTFLVFLFFFV
jgi:hypothetical protein